MIDKTITQLYDNDKEYEEIVYDILTDEDFKKLSKYVHHGDNRLNHCVRVSYRAYKKAKKRGLRYKEVARAGLLHDCMYVNNQKLDIFTRIGVLFTHPKKSLENAKNKYKLSELEENIIITHMFPLGHRIPKYKESWLVDFTDDVVSIKEGFHFIVSLPRRIIKRDK